MANDLQFSMGIDDKISPTLKKVETQLSTLKNKFSALQTSVAAVFTGAAVTSAIRYADGIADISKATGVATQSIIGFSNAVVANGGDAQTAASMIVKLGLSIEDANQGAVKMQDAFSDVNVSLNDLKTLSDQDLFAKTILGLSKIEDNSKRAALATQLLGKGAKGVDFAGVGGDIGRATQAASQYTAAIATAAEANDKMAAVFNTFQLSLLKAIKPMLDYLNAIDPKKIDDFVAALVQIGGAAVAFTALGKAIQYVGVAFTAVVGLWAAGTGQMAAGVTALGGAWASFTKTFSWALGYIDRFLRATPMFAKSNGLFNNMVTLIGKLAQRFAHAEIAAVGAAAGLALFATGTAKIVLALAGVAAVAYGIGSIIDAVFNTRIIDGFTEGVSNLYNMTKKYLGLGPKDAGDGRGTYTKKQIDGINKYADEQMRASKADREQLDTRMKALNEFKLQQNQIVQSYKEQNKLVKDALDLEVGLVGKTSDEAEKVRTIADIRNKEVGIIADLVKQQQALQQAMKVPGTSANEVKDLQDRYDAIGGAIASVKAETNAQVISVGQYIDKIQTAKAIEQARVITLEQMSQQMQKQQEIAGITSGVFSNLQKQLGEIQFGKEQKGRSVFEQQEEQIKRNITLLENDMANAVTEAFTTEDGIGNVAQYGIELKKVYDLTNQLRIAQLSELKISNQFATGWTDAFNKYIDSATNAATMASNAFNSITSNMNSAIDNFVETGKFSFKDFARSVIQDLAKIELKKQAALAMSGASSFLGSLFGGFFAEGGNPPVNKPSIVGENGPELFVPKTAGTIVPNGGSVANAAQGNTYITNNISAIDAKSVAQLFAENRKTLFGSVQMAQKELSYGR
jgi:hypothetical protein